MCRVIVDAVWSLYHLCVNSVKVFLVSILDWVLYRFDCLGSIFGNPVWVLFKFCMGFLLELNVRID